MAKKEILDKLSIYIPQKKMEEKPVERLIRLGEKRDRSINYMVVEAIMEYFSKLEAQRDRFLVREHAIQTASGDGMCLQIA